MEENKYLLAARQARKDGNLEEAKRFYDMLRMECPDNAEARYFYPYFKLQEGTKGECYNNYCTFCQAVASCVRDICMSDMADTEKIELLTDMFIAAKDEPRATNRVLNDLNHNNNIYSSEIMGAGRIGMTMLYNFGDTIEKYCSSNQQLMKIASEAWKAAVNYQQQWYGMGLDKSLPEKYTAKIKAIDPSFELPKKAGCISFAK